LEGLETRHSPAVIDVLGHLPLAEYNQFIASKPGLKNWGNEPSIAVNPTDPTNIAIVSFNYPVFVGLPAVDGKDGVWYSTDGGADWVIRFPVPTNPVSGEGTPNDQKIAYDSAGNLHAAMLTIGGPLAVYEGQTADPTEDGVNGRPATVWTWDTTRANVPAITSGTADQPWLALGPNGSGGLSEWVAYDSFRSPGAEMRVSVDSGSNFNAAQDNQVSNGVQPPTGLQTNPGLRIATDGLGNAYTIFGVGDAAGPSGTGTTHVLYRLNMSSNNGTSWKYTGSTTTGGLAISDNDATTFSTQASSFAGVNQLLGNITSVAAQKDGSHIYAAFGMKDGPNGTGADRIYVAEFHPDGSGGIVKRTDVVVATIPGQRSALPSLAVTDNGVVAMQYDTFDGTLIHVHLATSSDTGLTWTDQDLYDFNPSGIPIANGNRLLGDYQDLEALGNSMYGTFSARGNVNAGGINTTDKDVPFYYSFGVNVTPPTNQTAVEGTSQPFNLGSFSASGDGGFSVDVNWGDGTPHTIFSQSSPGTITPQSHTYAEETSPGYTVTVKVTQTSTGLFSSANFGVTVTDPKVMAQGVDVSAKEAIAFNGPVATFTDPGGAETLANYKVVSIDWGDGSPLDMTTGNITGGTPLGSKTAVFTVSGTHTYAEEGSHTITVVIAHLGDSTTTTTSTATIRDNFGLLVLDPTDSQALMVTGNGSVTVNHSGAVVVDSSDPRAIFLTGNATVSAAETDVAGDIVTHGHATLSGELNHEAATPDPFALPLPPMPSPTFAAVHVSAGSVPLSPGTYVGGIAVDGTASVTFSPGVYYMEGGGFTVTGKGSVTGTGVLLVNAPAGPGDTISITGQAVVTLTASNSLPDGFTPYDGIAVFQDPASANTVTVTGQGSLTVTGTVYAPDALLKIDGNGSVVVSAFTTPGLTTVGGVVVVFEAMVTGSGDLTINADPPDFPVPASAGGGVLINFAGHTARNTSGRTTADSASVADLSVDAVGLARPVTAAVGVASATPPVAAAGDSDFAGPRAVLAVSSPAHPVVLLVTAAASPDEPAALADAPAAVPAAVPGPGDGAGDTPRGTGRDGTDAPSATPSAQSPAPAAAVPDGEGLLLQARDAYFAAGVEAPVFPPAAAASAGGGVSALQTAAGLALGLGRWWVAPRRREEELRRRPLLK
jgi:hypothetical protein